MKVKEIIAIVKVAWDIISQLINFYKHLEEKYQWGKNKGTDVRAAVRDKKRDEFDANTVAVFTAKGLPEPDRSVQAYIRETVHEKVSGKKTISRRGKTAGAGGK